MWTDALYMVLLIVAFVALIEWDRNRMIK